jgi:hypothetical protein
VKNVDLFAGHIKVPVCERHLREHTIMLSLNSAGYDTEEILNQTAEWREQEYDKLVKNGVIDPTKVQI